MGSRKPRLAWYLAIGTAIYAGLLVLFFFRSGSSVPAGAVSHSASVELAAEELVPWSLPDDLGRAKGDTVDVRFLVTVQKREGYARVVPWPALRFRRDVAVILRPGNVLSSGHVLDLDSSTSQLEPIQREGRRIAAEHAFPLAEHEHLSLNSPVMRSTYVAQPVLLLVLEGLATWLLFLVATTVVWAIVWQCVRWDRLWTNRCVCCGYQLDKRPISICPECGTTPPKPRD